MKKILLLLAALLLVGLWQLSAAQTPGDPEEPPRLKKKKPKSDMPEPPPVPEKKPDPADDDKLDPRAQAPAGAPAEGDEQEVLRRLAKNARAAEERLLNRELGDGTRQVQDDILKDLDDLIARQSQPPQPKQSQGGGQSQQQQDQQPQGGQSGDMNPEKNPNQRPQTGQNQRPTMGGNDQGGQGQQQQMTRREQRKQREQERTQTARAPQQGTGQGQSQQQGPTDSNPNNNPMNDKNPMGTGSLTKPHDPRYDIWGHLTEAERLKMNRYMDEKFMDKYDELTRQYYRTIAEKSRRKGN